MGEDAGERALEKVRKHYEGAMTQLLAVGEDEAACQEAQYQSAAVALETVELQRKQESRTAESAYAVLGRTDHQKVSESIPEDANGMSDVYDSWHGELCTAEISCLRAHVHGLEATQEKTTGTIKRMAAQQEDHLASQIAYLQEDRTDAEQKYQILESEVNMMRSEVYDFRNAAHKWREASEEKAIALERQSIQWKERAAELQEALTSAQNRQHNRPRISVPEKTSVAQVATSPSNIVSVQRRVEVTHQTLHTGAAAPTLIGHGPQGVDQLTPGAEAYIRDLEERVREAERQDNSGRVQHGSPGRTPAMSSHGTYQIRHADPQPSTDPPVRKTLARAG